jgi:hypothetical protein
MASVLKVDKLDPQSGTALEIGTSGDTISVPSGATLDISSATLTPPATMPASSGVNFTALNATNLGSGTVPTARLGTGTASSSTILYGDNTWAAAGGGIDCDADSWWVSLNASTVFSGDQILDFGTPQKLGSNVTESAGVFTCATAGWYCVFGSFSNNNVTAVTTDLNPRQNSTTELNGRVYWHTAHAYSGQDITWVFELGAGDTIELYGYGSMHGNGTASAAMSCWGGFRLGA